MAFPRTTLALALLIIMLAAGCAEREGAAGAGGDACPAATAGTGQAGHAVHLRILVRGEAACVNVALGDARVVSTVVEPANTRLQPFIPKDFGTFRWDGANVLVTVSVPERGVSSSTDVRLQGETWLVVEVAGDGVRVDAHARDPYQDAD